MKGWRLAILSGGRTPRRPRRRNSNRSTSGPDVGPTRTWTCFLHVGTLASLSLAQPVFDLLSRYPQFLVAHRAGIAEICLLVLLLCLAGPAVVAAIERLLDRSAGDRFSVRGSGAALFVFPLALLVLKRIPEMPALLLVGLAAVLAWLSRLAYLRYRSLRRYLTFLSPAMLVVPVLFLTGASVRRVAAPAEPHGPALADGVADTPIVMVVFDELPVQSLLNRQGGIDSERFPSFAELAGQATWYRNAATVSHATQYAVPAILTGNRPEGDLGILPNLAGYPNNLFTWLRDSHRLNVFESATHFCPTCPNSAPGPVQKVIPLLLDLSAVYLHLVLPEDLASRLPDVRHGWTFPKPQKWWSAHPVRQFAAFLEALPEEGKPGLNFIHVQTPHAPWIHLPSGKRHISSRKMNLFLEYEVWRSDETLVTLAFQRHLLQVGFADRLLGRLLRKLRTSGLFDRSLIVVVSDHGASFRPGASRRRITVDNFEDLLAVPLFIKVPGQKRGRVSDRPTLTTDIFPSIAGILGVSAPWPTDGVPVMESGGMENRNPVSVAAGMFQFPGHRTTVCLEGASIEVSRGGVWSLLDVVVERDGKMSFFGWAADMCTLKPADSILLFADGDLVHQGMNRYPRPDVAEYYKEDDLEQSGFHLKFDPELFQWKQRVRCFAVFGDRIYELAYPLSFPWSAEPMSMQGAMHASQLEQPCSNGQEAARSFLIDRAIGADERGNSIRTAEFLAGLRELAWEAGPDGLFKFGPSESLLGKPLSQLQVTERGGLRIELDRPELYETVRLDSDFIPAAVEGWISVRDVEFVAVSVNGTLRTVAPTFDGPDGRRSFQALVPESAFRNGFNRVRTFAVAQTEKGVMLHTPLDN